MKCYHDIKTFAYQLLRFALIYIDVAHERGDVCPSGYVVAQIITERDERKNGMTDHHAIIRS